MVDDGMKDAPTSPVMPVLVTGIHALTSSNRGKAWIPVTSTGMTGDRV
jgi:hypothetical protein